MALESLSGPIPCVWGDNPAYPMFADRLGAAYDVQENRFLAVHWLDGLGLVGYWAYPDPVSSSVEHYLWGVGKLDGRVQTRGNWVEGLKPGIGSGNKPGKLLPDFVTGDLIGYDELFWTSPHRIPPDTGWWETQLEGGAPGYFRVLDRWLSVDRFGVVSVWEDGVGKPECTIPGIDSESLVGVSPGAVEGTYWFAWSTGQLALYDAIAKTPIGSPTGIGMEADGIWYSPALNVFISLNHNWDDIDHGYDRQSSLRIWANDPRPAILLAPEAVGTARWGVRNPLRARVLGSYGEPCPGRKVAWRLIGAGSLSAAATGTDADGYATVDYIAPLTGVEAVTVWAEVAP